MTKRIVQEDKLGCAIAALAMAVGVSYKTMRKQVAFYWNITYPGQDYRGLDFMDEKMLLWRYGYSALLLHPSPEHDLRKLCDRAKAILTVRSINVAHASHALYWDGKTIHDPSPLRRHTSDMAWKVVKSLAIIMPAKRTRYYLPGVNGGQLGSE